MKTPVQCLEEFASRSKLPRVNYEFEEKSLCGSTSFVCIGSLLTSTVEGEGGSKKAAKQNAALKLMKEFGVPYEEPQMITTKTNYVDYVAELTEFFKQYKDWPSPTFEILPMREDQFCCVCDFVGVKVKGYGLLKKDAKQNAAKDMFRRIKETNIEEIIKKITNLEDVREQEQLNYTRFGKWGKLNKSEIERNEQAFIEKKEKALRKIKRIMETRDERKPFVKLESWKKLEEYMTLQGWQHEVTMVKPREPYKLSLRINNRTVTSFSFSKEGAYTSLLETVNTFLAAGMDFDNTEIE